MFASLPAERPLYIQYMKDEETGYGHYSMITYITSYLRVRGYCDMCLGGYRDRLRKNASIAARIAKPTMPSRTRKRENINARSAIEHPPQ